MPSPGLSGGDKLMEVLNGINSRLTSAGADASVRVGFLEKATYPDGTSVATVAATQEFGGTIQRQAGSVTIYRKITGIRGDLAASGGGFTVSNRFAKRGDGTIAATYATPAYTINIPPRPFFRNMIKAKGPTWGDDIAKMLKQTDFDTATTLKLMGERITGQLRQSITDTNSPPLAASTIRKKGFSKPLVDTGNMQNSIDYEIST